MPILTKWRTLLDYGALGWKLGYDGHSKWLLITLLIRLKGKRLLRLYDSVLYTANIQVGKLKTRLHLRAEDILIVHELLRDNEYILPEMLEDPPACIVDLGAHIGLATLLFKAYFPNARIHCYEPDPDNYHILALNTTRLRGVTLHKEAVGVRTGTEMFFVRPYRHTASSLKPATGNELVVPMACTVRSLDDILTEIGDVDLIKFDIEGMEQEVFAASRRVHRVPHIVGEMKGSEDDLHRFLELFPHHQSRCRSLTTKIHLVYLHRKDVGT
jgi:FkbM family methyltransferase